MFVPKCLILGEGFRSPVVVDSTPKNHLDCRPEKIVMGK